MKRLAFASLAVIALVLGIAAARPNQPQFVADVYRVTPSNRDDTDALQRAIDLASRPGAAAGVVSIAPGKYRVTKTLVVPSVCGLTIRGAGMTYDQRTTGHYGGTSLYWGGPAGGTLLRGEGATLATISDLTLTGRPRPDAPNRAGILLHCAARPGWGGGQWTVRNVSGVDADVAVQFGTDRGDPVCSDSLLERVVFADCGTGLRVANDQGVNYLVSYLGAANCRRAVDFERGGCLQLNTASISGQGTEIRFGGGGPFVAASTLNNVRFEGGLRVTVGPYRRVVLDGFTEGAPCAPLALDVTAAWVQVRGATALWSKPSAILRGDGGGSVTYLSVADAMCPDFTPDVGAGCGFDLTRRFAGWGSLAPATRPVGE